MRNLTHAAHITEGDGATNITINLIEDATRAGQVENTYDQNGCVQTNIFVKAQPSVDETDV